MGLQIEELHDSRDLHQDSSSALGSQIMHHPESPELEKAFWVEEHVIREPKATAAMKADVTVDRGSNLYFVEVSLVTEFSATFISIDGITDSDVLAKSVQKLKM